MKGLVLSGGAGTRLRPITHTSAKQLVPVANKPILFYGLEDLANSGVTEVGIVLGATADEVRAAVGDGSKWGINVTYIQQEAPLGIAHAVQISREFLGDDDFVLYLGDNFIREGIARNVKSFRDARSGSAGDPAAQILLAEVADPHRFGVVEFGDNGEILGLVEKPENPPSNLALVGVYMFDSRVHEVIDSLSPSARGELEITEAIQGLLDRGLGVVSETVIGYWKDLGELDALLEGSRLVLETIESENFGSVDEHSQIDGRVQIGKGSVIESSTVRGPVVIGEDVVLRNAYIGPFTSIANRCVIEESEIEHSMLLEGCKLNGIGRIEDSLLGKAVEMTRTNQKPKATRMMVGDNSKIQVP